MRESVAVVVELYKADMNVCHDGLLADERGMLIVVDTMPNRNLALKGDRLVYSFTVKYGYSYRTE